MPDKTLYVSSAVFTVMVTVDDDTKIIKKAAPAVNKFIGQPLINLVQWMTRKYGSLKIVDIDTASEIKTEKIVSEEGQ